MDQYSPRPISPAATSLAELAELVAATGLTETNSDLQVSGICLSSAAVLPGDLFVALPGERTHGARYVNQAVQRGAVAVVTDRAGADTVSGCGVPVLVVPNPRSVLGALSAAVFQEPSRRLKMIGVTGTQGKTTTTRLLEGALTRSGVRAAVIGTIGTRINGQDLDSALTTPEAPELHGLLAVMVEQGVDLCAMELSSHALVLGRVDGIVFDVAAFLNLGRDHLDFHHDLDDYFAAKAQLFTPERARLGLVNVDDAYGRRLLAQASIPMQTMSTKGRPADWQVAEIEPDLSGSRFRVQGPEGLDFSTRINLVGEFNVANALCALALAANAGLDPIRIAAGLDTAPAVPGRFESVDQGQDFLAVVDYAHKPDAVEAALESLRGMIAGRLIVVLGAGGDRDQGKRPLMGEIAARLADVFIITDDNPRTEDANQIRHQIRRGVERVPPSDRAEIIEMGDRAAAITTAVGMAGPGDAVIIAGKGHETGQEINGVIHPFDDREYLRQALQEK